MLDYYDQYTALSYVARLSQGGHHYLAGGVGSYGYEPDVDYLFGVSRSIHGGGAAMNIPIVNVNGYDGDGGQTAEDSRLNYILQLGTLSSALEHTVPEQMFVTPENPGEAVSAVKALSKASAAGQRIYHITQTNQASVLPNIHHDSLVMDEIQNALSAGKEVITHTDAVSVPGWSGAGYIIYDPVTGDGAYKIGGGANGMFLQVLGYLLMAVYLVIAASAFVAGLLILPLITAGILVTTIAAILSIKDIERIWDNCSSFGAAILTFAIVVQNMAGLLVDLVSNIVSLVVQVSDAISLTSIFPDPTEDPLCDL